MTAFFDRWLSWPRSFLLVAMLSQPGCAAPRCQVPVDVAILQHPTKPRPAVRVEVRCLLAEHLCLSVDVSPTGLWCDGVQRVEVSP